MKILGSEGIGGLNIVSTLLGRMVAKLFERALRCMLVASSMVLALDVLRWVGHWLKV